MCTPETPTPNKDERDTVKVAAGVDEGVTVQRRDSLVSFGVGGNDSIGELITPVSLTAAKATISEPSRLASADSCGLDLVLVASIAPLITATSSPMRRLSTGGTDPLIPPEPPNSESASGIVVGPRSAKRKRW